MPHQSSTYALVRIGKTIQGSGRLDILQMAFDDCRGFRRGVLRGAVAHQRELVDLDGLSAASGGLPSRSACAAPSSDFLRLLPLASSRALVDSHPHEQCWIPVFLILEIQIF